MKQTMTRQEFTRAMRPAASDPEFLNRMEADVYAAVGAFHRAIDEAATMEDAAALRIRIAEMGARVQHEEFRALQKHDTIYRRFGGMD